MVTNVGSFFLVVAGWVSVMIGNSLARDLIARLSFKLGKRTVHPAGVKRSNVIFKLTGDVLNVGAVVPLKERVHGAG